MRVRHKCARGACHLIGMHSAAHDGILRTHAVVWLCLRMHKRMHISSFTMSVIVVEQPRYRSGHVSHHVCSAEDDQYPSRIDRTIVKKCTSTVIASFWGRATAQAWLDSDCTNDESAECAQCCVDDDGHIIEGCDCAQWTADCQAAVTSRTQARTPAWSPHWQLLSAAWPAVARPLMPMDASASAACRSFRGNNTACLSFAAALSLCTAVLTACAPAASTLNRQARLSHKPASLQALANAWIEVAVEKDTATCTTTVFDTVKKVTTKVSETTSEPVRCNSSCRPCIGTSLPISAGP